MINDKCKPDTALTEAIRGYTAPQNTQCKTPTPLKPVDDFHFAALHSLLFLSHMILQVPFTITCYFRERLDLNSFL